MPISPITYQFYQHFSFFYINQTCGLSNGKENVISDKYLSLFSNKMIYFIQFNSIFPPLFFIFTYSCIADNALGRSKKYIELSGKPGPASFHSPLYSRSKDIYNLTWSIESIPMLEEIRILYRKLLVNDSFH